MKIFLDTSSLFKLYHKEEDSDKIEQIFIDYNVHTIFLSEISKIEFASTIWKKVRTQQISELQAKEINGLINLDYNKFTFVQLDSIIITQAINLITKYGKQGLLTLDSIQLSTAVILKNQSSLFITSDKLLSEFFNMESLKIK